MTGQGEAGIKPDKIRALIKTKLRVSMHNGFTFKNRKLRSRKTNTPNDLRP